MGSMKIIGKDEFDQAKQVTEPASKELIDAHLSTILAKLDNPAELQKEIAAQVYLSLVDRMKKENDNLGFLTDSTRQWVTLYNTMCDSLHKNIHGDKSTQIHLHKISHSQIAAHIRNTNKIIDVESKVEVDNNGSE